MQLNALVFLFAYIRPKLTTTTTVTPSMGFLSGALPSFFDQALFHIFNLITFITGCITLDCTVSSELHYPLFVSPLLSFQFILDLPDVGSLPAARPGLDLDRRAAMGPQLFIPSCYTEEDQPPQIHQQSSQLTFIKIFIDLSSWPLPFGLADPSSGSHYATTTSVNLHLEGLGSPRYKASGHHLVRHGRHQILLGTEGGWMDSGNATWTSWSFHEKGTVCQCLQHPHK